jgi:hypothetical protein
VTTEPWWDGHPDLFPPDPGLKPLHMRNYSVKAWKMSDEALLLRGAVMDLQPGEPFAARVEAAGGRDPGGPLGVHHMVVDLVVGFPSLTITDASVVFETFPQPGCPGISSRYKELIGLSIARGFTHEVRQRFGGPRGCTHTTALLQAMGPVAVQCVFPMRRSGPPSAAAPPEAGSSPAAQVPHMRNTCHVWAEDGEIWQGLSIGRPPPIPLPMQRRMREAGVGPEQVDPRV